MQNLKYDTRMAEMNLTKGDLTPADWKQHLEKLPDMSHNVETISMDKDSDLGDQEQH